MSEKIKFYKKTSSVSAPTSADNGVHFIKPNGENEKFTIEVVDKGKKYVPDYIPLSGTAEGKPLTGTIITDLNDKPIFQEIGEEVEQGLRDNKEFILSENKVGYSVNYTKNGETIVMSNNFQVLPGGNVIGSIGFIKLKGHELSSTDIRLTSQGIGLNVENGGYILCNVDYTEVSLTSSDDKLLAQRSYVNKTIGNFKLPTNWESPQQRFSGLEDKGADATYDKVMVLDNNGNAGTKSLDNDIQIGGRNYLLNSSTPKFRAGNLGAQVTSTIVDYNSRKVTHVKSVGGNSKLKTYIDLGVPKQGEVVSVSFRVKTLSKPIFLWSYVDSGRATIEADTEQYVKWEGLKGNGINTVQIQLRTLEVEETLDLYIWDVKYEMGNKATDWTPAIEEYTNADTLIDILTNATEDQINTIRGFLDPQS